MEVSTLQLCHSKSNWRKLTMAEKITIDFQKMYNSVVNYFSHLPQDMIYAWSAVGVGMILLIVGIVMM